MLQIVAHRVNYRKRRAHRQRSEISAIGTEMAPPGAISFLLLRSRLRSTAFAERFEEES